ncbi:MAG TPA: hypothetical protein VJH95_06460 [Candidatus Nanoarchaeia archaeon]|nr:hypothetical protein [Candidatus Nanoarchaeia archaeon]
MAAGFYDLFYQLQGSGFYEFLLPFLLVFAVVFGILQKSNIFGAGNKSINAVVALVLGLLITSQFEVVQSLTSFLPRMSMFIIVAMMVLIFIALFAGDLSGGFGGIMLFVIAIIALLGTYWALGPVMGFEVPYWLEENWTTIAIIIIVIVVIVAVVKGGGSDGAGIDVWDNRADKWMGKKPAAKSAAAAKKKEGED